MDYVLIKNGKIIIDEELLVKDVLIGNDKVILIDDNIDRLDSETPIIDAAGKCLMPGTVDTNIFFSGMIEQGEKALKRFNQTQVLCGTTTLLEPVFPKTSLSFKKEWNSKKGMNYGVLADYGFHISLQDWDLFKRYDLLYGYFHEGIASFYLKWPVSAVELNDVKDLFLAASDNGLPILIELISPDVGGEDNFNTNFNYHENVALHLNQLRSVMGLAVEMNTRICLLNVFFNEEIDVIAPFIASGLIYVELMLPYHIGPHEEVFTDRDASFSGFPLDDKLRLIEVEKIWELLKNDAYLLARPMLKISESGVVKEGQVDNRPDQYFLLKNYLSVLYTAGVKSGKISFNDFISIVAYRTARLMGLYPKKGVIKVGSDADIVIWNPEYKRNLYCHFSGSDSSALKGFMLEGRVEFVFIKGHMAYNGESFSDEDIKGRYLYRNPCF